MNNIATAAKTLIWHPLCLRVEAIGRDIYSRVIYGARISMQLEGMRFFETAPWMAVFPGIFISAAVFGAKLFGDALRDVLDPQLRGR